MALNAESALTPAERVGLVGDESAQVRANEAAVVLDIRPGLRRQSGLEFRGRRRGPRGFSTRHVRIASTPGGKAALFSLDSQIVFA